jgi:hypothetical protein
MIPYKQKGRPDNGNQGAGPVLVNCACIPENSVASGVKQQFRNRISRQEFRQPIIIINFTQLMI